MDHFPTSQNVWNIYSANNPNQSTQPVNNIGLQQNLLQRSLDQTSQQPIATSTDQLTENLFNATYYAQQTNNDNRIFGVNYLPSMQQQPIDFNIIGPDNVNRAQQGVGTTFSVNSDGKIWRNLSSKEDASPTYSNIPSSIAMTTDINNPNISTACSTSNYISGLMEVFGKSLREDIPANPNLIVNAISSNANSTNLAYSLLKIQKLQQQQKEQQSQQQQQLIEQQQQQHQEKDATMEQDQSSGISGSQMFQNSIDTVLSHKSYKSKKSKDGRYENTLNALKKAGLLDITLQTGELMKKSKSLQKDIEMLEEIVKVTKHLMTEF